MNTRPKAAAALAAWPRLTLVLPSFNQAAFLPHTLASIFAQDYPALELIVMDGGSTDGSVEILRRHAERFAHWQSAPDAGQAAAINAGFARASGEIMGWLNSDDALLPGALHAVGALFAANPACAWCAGTGLELDRRGRVLREVRPRTLDFPTLSRDWDRYPLCQPAVFWRRHLWQAAGPLDESLHLALDFDLWLRFARHAPGTVLPATLAHSLRHPAAKTQARAAESFVETCLVLDRHGVRDLARAKLLRVARRAFSVDRALAPITRNPLYRRWRDRREAARDGTR